MSIELIISCEHASNHIPKSYQALFNSSVLQTHRGWDIGALSLFNKLKRLVPEKNLAAQHSRLLIELNRSLPKVFSDFSKVLSKTDKQLLINQYYLPYREQIQSWVENAIQQRKFALHLSIHSFTATLHGQVRNCDVGLLYDPSREFENVFCQKIAKELKENSIYKVRKNYPYRGTSDGLTTSLRALYSQKYYAGIEIEMNQKHFSQQGVCQSELINVLYKILKSKLQM